MAKNWRGGKSKNNAVTKSNAIVGQLWADYEKLGTWVRVGEKYHVSPAMAYRVAEYGYEPKKPSIRKALGFPVYMPAPVCPTCGIVHVSKRCPATRKPARPRLSASERVSREAVREWRQGQERLGIL